jgi:hypothetical protein
MSLAPEIMESYLGNFMQVLIEKYGVIIALLAQAAAVVSWSATLSYRVEEQEQIITSSVAQLTALDRKVLVLETQYKVIEKQLELQTIALEDIRRKLSQ